MLRRSLPALLAASTLFTFGCRTSLDSEPDAMGTAGRVCKVSTVAACMQAESQQSLAWIETNIFQAHCAFSGCHNGTTTQAGRINLKDAGMSHDDLVNIDSDVATGKKLVVPGQPKQSYLMIMLQQYKPSEMEPTPVPNPPTDIGFMPQGTGGVPICCQKIDAIERWITAGAMNN